MDEILDQDADKKTEGASASRQRLQIQCAEQEASALAKAEECSAIKNDAQRDLDEALPALEQAVQCLKKLKMSHLQEVKALANPPAGVKLTMEAVCIMFEVSCTCMALVR